MSASRSAALKLIVEEETFRLKREGWSFTEIAAWLNQQLRDSFDMPVYVSRTCCRKALKRAITRIDKVDSHESGLMEWERCEAIYKAVARRAIHGDLDAAQVALRALRIKAEIKAAYFARRSGEEQDMQLGYAESKATKTSIELTQMRTRIYARSTTRVNRLSDSNPRHDEARWQEELWEEFRHDNRLIEAHKISVKELEWLRSTVFLGQLKEKRDFIFLLRQLRAGLNKPK